MTPPKTIYDLLEKLALYGGELVNTASLSPEEIETARSENRMYVTHDGYGYVWAMPRFPETVEEVKAFEVTQLITAMQEAITILEPALQAIRDRRPTTAGLGGIEARIKGAIGQLSEALKNIEK